jgi:hypothetical protein
VYVRDHSAATFSHGICPECLAQYDVAEKAARPDAR